MASLNFKNIIFYQPLVDTLIEFGIMTAIAHVNKQARIQQETKLRKALNWIKDFFRSIAAKTRSIVKRISRLWQRPETNVERMQNNLAVSLQKNKRTILRGSFLLLSFITKVVSAKIDSYEQVNYPSYVNQDHKKSTPDRVPSVSHATAETIRNGMRSKPTQRVFLPSGGHAVTTPMSPKTDTLRTSLLRMNPFM